jgi:hypothetical protein
MRRCLGRRLHQPVDVIRLDSPIQNGPAGFRCDRNANFTQTIRNRTHQPLLGPFRDPHPRVIHRIHRRVSTSELFSFHVDSVSGIDRTSQGNLRVRTPFGIITSAKAQGFPAPESYNLDEHVTAFYLLPFRSRPWINSMSSHLRVFALGSSCYVNCLNAASNRSISAWVL